MVPKQTPQDTMNANATGKLPLKFIHRWSKQVSCYPQCQTPEERVNQEAAEGTFVSVCAAAGITNTNQAPVWDQGSGIFADPLVNPVDVDDADDDKKTVLTTDDESSASGVVACTILSLVALVSCL